MRHYPPNLRHFLSYLLIICRKFELLISQDSAATCLRWGGNVVQFCSKFRALSSSTNISKSDKILQSYREFNGVNFFETQCRNKFRRLDEFLRNKTAPCGSQHDDTISFSQPLRTNWTYAILLFVLYLVMSSIWSCYVRVLFSLYVHCFNVALLFYL